MHDCLAAEIVFVHLYQMRLWGFRPPPLALLAAILLLLSLAPAGSPVRALELPPAVPEPSARLSGATVSASADGQVLLTVAASGRFAIRAVSKTGVALQLVDMITGPGDVAGEPGVRDGRLDVLLDKGVSDKALG